MTSESSFFVKELLFLSESPLINFELRRIHLNDSNEFEKHI